MLDLVQHVAMWDEIVLAIVSAARRGRLHWSLDRLRAPAEPGCALNVGGVEAGRLHPPGHVVHRSGSVRQALSAAIDEIPEAEWTGGLEFRHDGQEPQTLSGLCHYVSTPEAIGRAPGRTGMRACTWESTRAEKLTCSPDEAAVICALTTETTAEPDRAEQVVLSREGGLVCTGGFSRERIYLATRPDT